MFAVQFPNEQKYVNVQFPKVSLAFITANVIISYLNTYLNFARYTALKDLDIAQEGRVMLQIQTNLHHF